MTVVNDDLNPKKLKWAYWYVTHKIYLRKWLAGLLIIASIFLFAYSLMGLIFYLIEMDKTAKMVVNMSYDYINYDQFRAINQPQALRVTEVNLLKGGQVGTNSGLHYDLVAQVENFNPRWRVEFNYRFVAGDWQGEKQTGFILPQEKKVILDLGVVDLKLTDAIKIEIDNISWHRVSSHQIKDIEQYKSKRLSLKIEDVEFTPVIKIGGAESGSSLLISQAKFNIANISAYSYWNLPLNIILMQGEKIVGVNRYTIDKFKSGSKRGGEVFWRGSLPMVERIVIEPNVNIFDNSVYAELGAVENW